MFRLFGGMLNRIVSPSVLRVRHRNPVGPIPQAQGPIVAGPAEVVVVAVAIVRHVAREVAGRVGEVRAPWNQATCWPIHGSGSVVRAPRMRRTAVREFRPRRYGVHESSATSYRPADVVPDSGGSTNESMVP